MSELNSAFGAPGSDRYKNAMEHNFFHEVKNEPDNYRTLIWAYVEAGVDVCGRWGAYLRVMGKTKEGQQDIHEIAKARYAALKKGDVPMVTSTHGGNRVKLHEGSGPNDPTTIDAPFS